MRPVTSSDPVPAIYRWFAEQECASSPSYARLATAVADSAALVALLESLPLGRRQPNLLFATLRRLDVDVTDPVGAIAWARHHWPEVVRLMTTRRTQTNEAARCAALVAAMSLIPGPIALIELGASAGLCLIPDAWDYDFVLPRNGSHRLTHSAAPAPAHGNRPDGNGPDGDEPDGDAELAPLIRCVLHGMPPALRLPEIRHRVGVDLNPLDPSDPETTRWLQCLIWPEHTERAERLELALRQAAHWRPLVWRGDLVIELPRLLAEVPAGLTTVVSHSAALAYLDPADRQRVVKAIATAGARRVGLEGSQVLPHLAAHLPADEQLLAGHFALSLDDQMLGIAAPHGGELWWTAP